MFSNLRCIIFIQDQCSTSAVVRWPNASWNGGRPAETPRQMVRLASNKKNLQGMDYTIGRGQLMNMQIINKPQDWVVWKCSHKIKTVQGSPHLQASVSARYAKIFYRYAAEIADMHLFFTRYAPIFNTFNIRKENSQVIVTSVLVVQGNIKLYL